MFDLVLSMPRAHRGRRPVPDDRHDLEANPFLGRIITGRIHSGSIKPNQTVKVLNGEGKLVENGRISKILAFRGLERQPVEEAHAGDIVAIAGLSKGTVADTFCDPAVTEPLTAQPIDPPTVTMTFLVNDSPLAGTEGDKVTSRVIRDRLLKEAEGNVALKIEEVGRQGFLLRLRPRRIAARRSHRDHAPRRLRACRLASARRHAQGRKRHPDGADRRGRHRR
jgi:GTP-binding protein